MCLAAPAPPSSAASSPPWIETGMQMNGKFTRGNYRWREGGPTCSGEGRGLSFSLSQRTVSWDGVLVACVLPMTWLREGIRGKVLFGVAPWKGSVFKSTHSMPISPVPACVASWLSFSVPPGTSNPKGNMNGTPGMQFLCCPVYPLLIQQSPLQCHPLTWSLHWCPRQGAHCLLKEGLLGALAGSKKIMSSC